MFTQTPHEKDPRVRFNIKNRLSRYTLHWRYNDHDGVSNHQPHGCLLNRLFRRRPKKTSKLLVTGLCAGNSPGPVNSPHKRPVTRKMFPFDDVIMKILIVRESCHDRFILKMIGIPMLPQGRIKRILKSNSVIINDKLFNFEKRKWNEICYTK